jgi:hypothetical protein
MLQSIQRLIRGHQPTYGRKSQRRSVCGACCALRADHHDNGVAAKLVFA